ncbi:hypothetical protein [Sunxiuqinia sp. sy24]|uniref:hypothetical protein n=1 Tax=Sunxiuqinia sp. sy24 TaxID=3461495 RepID=UPI0040463F35
MKVEHIKIGTPVTYYTVVKANGEKWDPKPTFITSDPWTLGDGAIVCKVDGVAGGVAISHLEKREIVVNKNRKS